MLSPLPPPWMAWCSMLVSSLVSLAERAVSLTQPDGSGSSRHTTHRAPAMSSRLRLLDSSVDKKDKKIDGGTIYQHAE